MLTIEELNRIYNSKKDLVAMRHHSNEAPKNCEYKRQVLICGGTGCNSSGSKKVMDVLYEEVANSEGLKAWGGCR